MWCRVADVVSLCVIFKLENSVKQIKFCNLLDVGMAIIPLDLPNV